jgi:signal transduction histidine kinase
MMQKIYNLLKSFSFRAGLLIFTILCITLLVIRIFIFYSAIKTDEHDVKELIRAHTQEIDEIHKKFGAETVAASVTAFTQEMRDSNIILVYKYNGHFYGNYTQFPELNLKDGEWFSFKIKKYERIKKEKVERNYQARIKRYSDTESIIVAYDTQKIDKAKRKLPQILIQYIAIATLVSFWISLCVVWLLNRYLHRFNFAYRTIQKGNLKHRIKTNGSNDQFDILSQNFNSLMEWINALLGTIKDTTNNLAHDLRTPISRHRLNLEAILNKHDITPEAAEELESSIAEVDRVIKIFNNILSISKAEDKSGIENFKIFSINEMLSDLAEFFEPLIEENGQKLELSLPDENINFYGEPKLLTQSVYNLIDNAIKYNSENGTVSIKLEQNSDKQIIIAISDNGEGIADEMLEKVKEKFFRLDTARTSEGIGLGLSLIDSVVKLHAGTFILQNIRDENGNITGLQTTISLKNEK